MTLDELFLGKGAKALIKAAFLDTAEGEDLEELALTTAGVEVMRLLPPDPLDS